MAERNGGALRLSARSTERFSEAAIWRGLRSLKTSLSRSMAWLSRVTRADQRLVAFAVLRVAPPADFRPVLRVAVFLRPVAFLRVVVLRVVVLRAVVFLRPVVL